MASKVASHSRLAPTRVFMSRIWGCSPSVAPVMIVTGGAWGWRARSPGEARRFLGSDPRHHVVDLGGGEVLEALRAHQLDGLPGQDLQPVALTAARGRTRPPASDGLPGSRGHRRRGSRASGSSRRPCAGPRARGRRPRTSAPPGRRTGCPRSSRAPGSAPRRTAWAGRRVRGPWRRTRRPRPRCAHPAGSPRRPDPRIALAVPALVVGVDDRHRLLPERDRLQHLHAQGGVPLEGLALFLGEQPRLPQELLVDPHLADVVQQRAVVDVAALRVAEAHAPADHVRKRGDRPGLAGVVDVPVFEEGDEEVRGVGEEVVRPLVLHGRCRSPPRPGGPGRPGPPALPR